MRDGTLYNVRVHRAQPVNGNLSVETDERRWEIPIAEIVSCSIEFDFSYINKPIDYDADNPNPYNILDG